MLDVKEKMADLKVWLEKTAEKFKVKQNSDNNEKVRNFIIIPNGGVIMATENSGLSHKEILRKIMYGNSFIENAIMKYPCGYYKSGQIFFFQGDLSKPETIKPVAPDNIALIKNKFGELKKMLKCGDNVSIKFHAKMEKIKDVFNHLLHLKTKYTLQKSK